MTIRSAAVASSAAETAELKTPPGKDPSGVSKMR